MRELNDEQNQVLKFVFYSEIFTTRCDKDEFERGLM